MRTTVPLLGRLEYLTILTGTLIGGSLFVWPLHLVMDAGRESSIAVFMAGVLGTGFIVLQVGAWSPDQDASILEWTLSVAGIILTLAIDAVVSYLFVDMLKEFFFARTPRLALMAPLLALTSWWATASWKRVARRAQLWLPLVFFASVIPVLVSLQNWAHPLALEPRNWTAFGPEVRGALVLTYEAVPIGATARVVGRRLAASARDRLVVALLASATFWFWLFLLYTITVGSLGTDALVHLGWPLVYTLEETTLDSTFVLSRLGVLVIFGWTALVTMSLVIHLRVAATLAEDLRTGWTSINLAAIGLGMALFLTALVVFDTGFWATRMLLAYLNPLAEGFIVVDVLAALTVWGLRRVRENSRRKALSARPEPGGG